MEQVCELPQLTQLYFGWVKVAQNFKLAHFQDQETMFLDHRSLFLIRQITICNGKFYSMMIWSYLSTQDLLQDLEC